jgi:hypothetical protein
LEHEDHPGHTRVSEPQKLPKDRARYIVGQVPHHDGSTTVGIGRREQRFEVVSHGVSKNATYLHSKPCTQRFHCPWVLVDSDDGATRADQEGRQRTLARPDFEDAGAIADVGDGRDVLQNIDVPKEVLPKFSVWPHARLGRFVV